MFGGEEDMTFFQKFKLFCATHWRGLVCVISPLFFMIILRPFPPQKAQWCLYCLLNMAVFWVTECIPLAITSFLPIILFPLTGVMTTRETCKAYMNDSILMFVGSLILAFAVEQSGLHKRLAYGAINLLGYSHLKLLIAMSLVTMFVSMWVTNTAACTMMVPINFAILRVFDSQGICKLYEKNSQGEQVASDITTAYFCAVTYSATIGGIGTLVGTATNIAVKGLFQSTYPEAPELISFPKFSAFGVPYMILMEASTILIMAVQFFGLFRGGSETNKRATITPKAKELAQKAIADDSKKMGSFSFWEAMVLILFIIAMIGFFTRSPQFFKGWADIIIESLGITDKKYIRDSTWALSICFAMFVLPSTPAIFKNCFAGDRKELPKGPVPSVLDWSKLNAAMPYSFMFLLGGGFALSEGAKLSGLNDAIGDQLKKLSDLPNLALLFIISVFVIFITNFASNVAVANVMTPLTMQLAKEIKVSPLWYCLLTGFSASYCFMIPVGTPGNLVVQSAAKISTINMVKAGAGPTLAVIAITWIFFAFYCPIIFDVKEVPKWA